MGELLDPISDQPWRRVPPILSQPWASGSPIDKSTALMDELLDPVSAQPCRRMSPRATNAPRPVNSCRVWVERRAQPL